ncbi:MAG TPA: arsenic resistance N-acetyltransferase ArsN2 [Thermoanaerobaculia bacterium]|jgi:N-acetylglutamate synthase-like GNAT family acetyltransferase|nr:arsenic resistance N-acetyltransferase ArsN2 [Thermoanaerobaculia bacterium]
MVDSVEIAAATERDIPAIKDLLVASELPTAGVDEHWRTFIVARDGDRIVGCGGAEAYQFAALIRSIAVVSDYRSQGLGRKMVRQLLDRLASRGLREFYLLTTTAEAYFKKRGFKTIDRDEVHPQLLNSREFQDACPSSATCMRLVMLV